MKKEILPMKKALKTIDRQDHFNKSKIKLKQLKLKLDNEFRNTVELDVDDIVYFLKMDEIFEYSFTDSKLKIKDLLEEYKLKDLVYVTGYLPDDSTKKVIIEESNFSTLKDTRKCLDLIAKKIKIKEGK